MYLSIFMYSIEILYIQSILIHSSMDVLFEVMERVVQQICSFVRIVFLERKAENRQQQQWNRKNKQICTHTHTQIPQ